MTGPAQPAKCQVDTCPMTTNETIPFLLRLELDGGTSLEEKVSYERMPMRDVATYLFLVTT